MQKDGTYLIIIRLGEEWRKDYNIFRESHYSKMSEAAKTIIRMHSGLNYMELVGDDVNDFKTDIRILALDRKGKAAKFWNNILFEGKEGLLNREDELLPKLKESDYYQMPEKQN